MCEDCLGYDRWIKHYFHGRVMFVFTLSSCRFLFLMLFLSFCKQEHSWCENAGVYSKHTIHIENFLKSLCGACQSDRRWNHPTGWPWQQKLRWKGCFSYDITNKGSWECWVLRQPACTKARSQAKHDAPSQCRNWLLPGASQWKGQFRIMCCRAVIYFRLNTTGCADCFSSTSTRMCYFSTLK